MDAQEILSTLEELGKPQTAAIYKRHGAGDNVFGVLTTEIGRLQKKIKVDHALAMQLSAFICLAPAGRRPPEADPDRGRQPAERRAGPRRRHLSVWPRRAQPDRR